MEENKSKLSCRKLFSYHTQKVEYKQNYMFSKYHEQRRMLSTGSSQISQQAIYLNVKNVQHIKLKKVMDYSIYIQQIGNKDQRIQW